MTASSLYFSNYIQVLPSPTQAVALATETTGSVAYCQGGCCLSSSFSN